MVLGPSPAFEEVPSDNEGTSAVDLPVTRHPAQAESEYPVTSVALLLQGYSVTTLGTVKR